ncbi:hypothetical protein BRC77_06005 [Halobacteriales archaeon QH_8_64_26]|nr:MAG: hypothetical protein BRC77_06005 [Halobacteriales archaeon QH_8_64_26]
MLDGSIRPQWRSTDGFGRRSATDYLESPIAPMSATTDITRERIVRRAVDARRVTVDRDRN